MNNELHCPYAKHGVCVRQAEHNEPCEVFVCVACHETKPACAGGDAVGHNPRGELCTGCWFARRREREAAETLCATTAELNRCVIGDCRETLATLSDGVFACCVTSPPYWGLRDYGHADQIGLEATPEAYVEELVAVFRQVRRVLRDDGTLWLNLGDVYSGTQSGGQGESGQIYGRAASRAGVRKGVDKRVPGLKPKDLCGMPWRVAFALQADGWYLRSDIIWHKPNPMPESVIDRPTKAHEYVFLLAKSERYRFDADAIKEPSRMPGRVRTDMTAPKSMAADPERQRTMPTATTRIDPERRNTRTVWSIASQPYDGAHFATMPPKLAERCILAGCPMGGAVIDPFFGTGTVGHVAEQLGRQWFGCELNPEYAKLAAERTAQVGLPYAGEVPA